MGSARHTSTPVELATHCPWWQYGECASPNLVDRSPGPVLWLLRAPHRRTVMSDCTAVIDTLPFGIVQCHRQDGRNHSGGHYYDHIVDGRLDARVDWYDDMSGYGVTPAVRLGPPRPS